MLKSRKGSVFVPRESLVATGLPHLCREVDVLTTKKYMENLMCLASAFSAHGVGGDLGLRSAICLFSCW